MVIGYVPFGPVTGENVMVGSMWQMKVLAFMVAGQQRRR
jgi:hypothetical protein